MGAGRQVGQELLCLCSGRWGRGEGVLGTGGHGSQVADPGDIQEWNPFLVLFMTAPQGGHYCLKVLGEGMWTAQGGRARAHPISLTLGLTYFGHCAGPNRVCH